MVVTSFLVLVTYVSARRYHRLVMEETMDEECAYCGDLIEGKGVTADVNNEEHIFCSNACYLNYQDEADE